MSLKDRIFEILKDGRPHSTTEITFALFPSGRAELFRLGARIDDLKKDGYSIEGCYAPDHLGRRKYWYQIQGVKSGSRAAGIQEAEEKLAKERREKAARVAKEESSLAAREAQNGQQLEMFFEQH